MNFIPDRFKDKVMVITGAAGGICREMALRAAKEGALLICADRKVELSAKTEAELKEINPKVKFIVTDVQYFENCKSIVDAAIEMYGRIDILVNGAGIIGEPGSVDRMSEEMLHEVIGCNLYSQFAMSHYAFPHMMAAKQGVVLNFASVAGMTGFPGNCAYGASKHAVVGLSRNMALDGAKFGIRVNSISPGTTLTPMYDEALAFLRRRAIERKSQGLEAMDQMLGFKIHSPQGRGAQAEEVSNVALYLCSDECSNVTGANLPVDGGFTTF